MKKYDADLSTQSETSRQTGENSSAQTDWPRNLSLGDLLREVASQSGERIALVDGVADPKLRRRWTYRQLLAEAEQVARGLLTRFKVGDRIAVSSPNCPEWVILEYGTALAGMVLVPANPAYRQAELVGILQDSGASALFHADKWRDNDIAAMAATARASDLPDLTLISFSRWDEFLTSGEATRPLPQVEPGDPVIIQFTSGTTGRPKGAILHHGISNPPRSVALACDFRQHGVWLNSMPMYHIGGASVSLLATLARHGAFVQMREWDPTLALDLIEAERCNGMLLVPTMVIALLDVQNSTTRDLSSIDFILTGASPVPPALLERVTRQIGCRLLISFGMTESGGPVSNTTIGDGAHELANTLGRALPNVHVEVRDPATCTNVPTGTVGEMWIKGKQIMLGYYGRDEETRATITPDGWLRSGDLITMDERGYISIVGRLKDMIIRGGANIYPREIENVLMNHHSVGQVSVIGLPDEKWGEVVLAVIQPAVGQNPDFKELDRYCCDQLAKFKVPSLWCLTDGFPMNAMGKIQKFELEAWVRKGKLSPVSLR